MPTTASRSHRWQRQRDATNVAALYVQTGGVYYGLPGVDPWDEQRDARRYAGPHPVVAHPPCERWCSLAKFVKHVYGYAVGDDGGTFAAALRDVREWGGVLEHPAHSLAWREFSLPRPQRGCWTRTLLDQGWVTEVSQVAYGHRARKRTWLYYVGESAPTALNWSEPEPTMVVGHCRKTSGGTLLRCNKKRLTKRESSRTPLPFRDALISLARGSRVQEVER